VEQKAHRRRSGAGAAASSIFVVAAGWEKAPSAGRRAPGPPAPPPAAPRPQARPHRILGAPPAPDLGILGAPPAPNLGSSTRSMYFAKAGHRLQRRWTTTSLMLAREPPSAPTRYHRRAHLGSTRFTSSVPDSSEHDRGSRLPCSSGIQTRRRRMGEGVGVGRVAAIAPTSSPLTSSPPHPCRSRTTVVGGSEGGSVGRLGCGKVRETPGLRDGGGRTAFCSK
jgi:hypothetical protein